MIDVDTLYFSENCIKIIKISKKKGRLRSRRPTRKIAPVFRKYHNTLCCPSKILYKHFFSISLGYKASVSPKRNWKKLCWKFWTGITVKKYDQSPTSRLARLENKYAGKVCLKGLLIKIALSCHVQENEGIQWIVTRKNMIYYGCESCKPPRHGKKRKWLFRNDVNYPRESTNTPKNPSRIIIIIIINNIHNIVIFQGLKKILKKRKKNGNMFSRFMSANAYVTGDRTCDMCDVISLQHETEAVYIPSRRDR